ncbi:PASTA domain-containing protein [bacterium]|nr:PASTA domain-containing protein [candidate division CSSED10-310 bacterium]
MSRLHWLGRAGIAIAGFLILAILSGWMTLKMITKGGSVLVPDLMGKEIVTALQDLQKQHLYGVVEGAEHHTSVPKGSVIRQSPSPGETRKQYASVRMVLSSGPEHITMPDLREFGIRQSRHELSCLGFNEVLEKKIRHPTTRMGHVIAHAPGPGEIVLPGAPIKCLVSLGPVPARYRMPDLIGRKISDMDRNMERLFSVDIKISHDTGFEPGIILHQNPEPGESIYEGSPVSLIVKSYGLPDEGSVSVFTYRVPQGIVSKELKVTIDDETGQRLLRQQTVKPAEEVKLMIPKTGNGNITVYLDGEKVLTQSW